MQDQMIYTSQSALIELLIRPFKYHGIRLIAFIIVSVLFVPAWLLAESSVESDEYKTKAAFLYNFSKFIVWPSQQSNENVVATFDICILGENYFGEAVESLTGKTKGGAQVVVSYIDDLPFTYECHILFISKSEAGRLSDVLQSVANQPVLTVSDIDGFVSNGGCIEFTNENDKIDFNINARAAHHPYLEFSAQLLELSKMAVRK